MLSVRHLIRNIRRTAMGFTALSLVLACGAFVQCAPVTAVDKASGSSADDPAQADTEKPAAPSAKDSDDATLSGLSSKSHPLEDPVMRALSAQDYTHARDLYKAELAANPNNVRVLLGLAYVEKECGSLDDALKHCRQATLADPDNVDAHIMLGRFLAMDRQTRAAYLQFTRALELKPRQDQLQKLSSPMLRALVEMGDFREADRLSNKWAHDFNHDATAQFNRGWVLQMQNDSKKLPDVVASYLQAIQLDPSLDDAHFNLALAEIRRGEKQQAAAHLKYFLERGRTDQTSTEASKLLMHLQADKSENGHEKPAAPSL